MNKKYRVIIEDILSGKNIWQNYSFLKSSQWWSEDKMEFYRTEKLRRLLKHCYSNVPIYKYLLDQSGLNPESIRSTHDLKLLPVIDKKYILKHYDEFTTSNKLLNRGIRFKKTSGTTGQVLKFTNDQKTRSIVWGSFMRFKDWMGYDYKSPYISFSGRDILKKGKISNLRIKLSDIIGNKKTFNSYDIGDKEIRDLIKILDKEPRAILRGYVLNIVDIATILKRLGLEYSVQAISTTAEPLLDFHRRTIQDSFNCGIYDQYGCGEIGGVAYECNQHNGLHITEEHVILENDENNELILTDLDNYSFPFIRYKNGDKAIISNSPCKCGRKSKLISKIQGRTSDNVIGMNGNPIHWGYFHHLLIETKIATNRNMIKFQLVQKSTSKLRLNIVSEPLTKTDKMKLSDIITNKLGPVDLTIENVIDIPKDSNGKFRAIISDVTL